MFALMTTGGGFSSFFRRPDYQQDAVAAFLKVTAAKGQLVVVQCIQQDIPDIALQANDLHAFVARFPISLGGTSALTPL